MIYDFSRHLQPNPQRFACMSHACRVALDLSFGTGKTTPTLRKLTASRPKWAVPSGSGTLESATTMARLPPPMPPPVRHVDRAALDDLDDQESLAKTVERKSVRITTARFASVAPCAIDVVAAPSSPPSPPPSSSSSLPWTSLPSALLRHPRAAIGAALWLACVIAGLLKGALGQLREHLPEVHHRDNDAAEFTHQDARRAPRTRAALTCSRGSGHGRGADRAHSSRRRHRRGRRGDHAAPDPRARQGNRVARSRSERRARTTAAPFGLRSHGRRPRCVGRRCAPSGAASSLMDR